MSDFLRDKPQNATPDLASSEQAHGSEQAQVSEQPKVELVAGTDTPDLQLQSKSTPAPDSTPRPKAHLNRRAKWILALSMILLTASLIGVNNWIGKGSERPQLAYFYWDKDKKELPTLLLQCQFRELRANMAHNLEMRHSELINMANIYLVQGEMENAEQALLQAAGVESNSHFVGQPNVGPSGRKYCAFDLLMQIYADRGDWKKAAEIADKARQVDPFVLLPDDVPRQRLAAEIYSKSGRPFDAARALAVAHRATRRLYNRGDFEPVFFPDEASETGQIDADESRSFNEIFPSACSMLEVGDVSAARHYFQFMIDRKVAKPEKEQFILREPSHAYDYTLLSKMLLPVTSVMLDDYKSAKSQFPEAFTAMNRLAQTGIDTSEEQELLFHHYARYLYQTGDSSEAKKYEEQSAALKQRREQNELKPWWKKSS